VYVNDGSTLYVWTRSHAKTAQLVDQNPLVGFAIDEYHSDNFDHADLGFFGGGNIACNNSGARPIQSSGPLPPDSPRWGSGWKAAVKQHYNRSVGFGMQGESPAYRGHYFDLDPTYRDAYGNPLLRITFNWTDNERKMVRWIADNPLTQIANAMGGSTTRVGGDITDYSIVPYQSTHVQGGAIMGADPTTSVVNKFLQTWDVPNVFVVGAANFPQNAGYNPTGTVGALAYRAADAIINQYLPSPGPLA
jgi:gluconate 2-dehydrogenase alpha chain